MPLEVCPYLSGARLHAGLKKDGGIRPIAVGNIIRRLTAKCFSYAIANRASSYLSPCQLGVAVRGGLEAIIHSVREVVETKPEDVLILQVDLVNAFNCVDRDAVFKEV